MTYFLQPILEALRITEDPEERDRLLRLIAVNVGDDIALATLVGELPAQSEFYPEARPQNLTTTSAIDDFLDTFAPSVKGGDTGTLDRIAPAVDYATLLMKEAQGVMADPSAPRTLPEAPRSAEECIKNRDYARALEIIQSESLKNPEKSIYFADQIRFLRKLLLIEAASQR